jgi:hypothetical protein
MMGYVNIDCGHKFFLDTFELAFCITVHCSQGLSIDEAYTIWEWEKFSKKMKYRRRLLEKGDIITLI